MYRIFVFFILVLFLFSCSSQNERNTLVAKVYNTSITQKDLDDVLGEDASELVRKQYVDAWVRKQLVLAKAKLPRNEQEEIAELVENYKESLIVQRFKDRYVEKNMENSIDSLELMEAYDRLKNEFNLKTDIFKAELIITKVDHPDVLDLKSFFKKKNFEEFYASLAGQVERHLKDTTKWLSFRELSQSIPLGLLDEDQLKDNSRFVLENEDYLFFVRVFEYMDKNEIPPLSYMKSNLEKAILEKRKEELLDKYSTELYTNAVKNNQIIIN